MSGFSANLAPLFGGATPTFLTDSKVVVAALREWGARARSFDELGSITEADLANVVVVPIEYDNSPTGDIIERTFGHSAMLVIPIGSFCGTDRGALYLLEKLQRIDLSVVSPAWWAGWTVCQQSRQFTWLAMAQTSPRSSKARSSS